jgi:predicted enzyme related to lactoylglutathione lyase
VPRTTGLIFIVPVRDLDKASRFYCDAFGVEEVFRTDEIVFVGFPGTDTAVGLLKDDAAAGGGPQNVGFHLDHATNYDEAVQEIERAGGKIVERGEHAPDVPFARITDPDGNELWV